MVERGPSFEQNSPTIEVPQTGNEQPFVTQVEQSTEPASQPDTATEATATGQPEQSGQTVAPEELRSYSLDAVASGAETINTLDLQGLMQSQFESAEDNDQLPDAA